MTEIECLVCGTPLVMPKWVDTDKYDGQVVCRNCGSLLQIKLVKSKVQGVKVKGRSARKLQELLEELKQKKTQ